MTTVHNQNNIPPRFPTVQEDGLTSEMKSLVKRVAYYTGFALAGVAEVFIAIMGSIPKLIGRVMCENVCLHHPENHVYALKEQINQAQLQKLREALDAFSNNKTHLEEAFTTVLNDPTSLNLESFHQYDAITSTIAESSKDNCIRAEDILEMLNTFTQCKIYQALQESDPPHPLVLLIDSLAYAGMTADGSKAIREYGEKIVSNQAENFSLDNCATIMDEIAGNSFAFNRNSSLASLFWAICNPMHFWHGQASNFIPTEYNAHYSNTHFVGHEFKHPTKERTALHLLGPTPTNHGLYRAYLSHLKRNKWTESRISQQGPVHAAENKRVAQFQKETDDFIDNGTLDLSIFSFDAPIMKAPLNYIPHGFSVSNFINAYKKFIMLDNPHRSTIEDQKNDNGFNISPSLTDERLDKVFATAESCFIEISKNNTFWNSLCQTPKGQERLCRMMQLGIQAFMRTETIYQGLEKGNLHVVSEACKQDVDRGPTLNIASQLFFRLLSDDSACLTKEEMHSLIGTVIGRAQMVDGRQMLYTRYEVLSDLLHFIGTSGKHVKTLSSALRKHVSLK